MEIPLKVLDEEEKAGNTDVEIVVLEEEVSTDIPMQLYPNPAVNEVSLIFADTEIKLFGIYIYHPNGKTVKVYDNSQIEKEGNVYKIELPALSNGIYSLQCFTNTSKKYVRKLMIQN